MRSPAPTPLRLRGVRLAAWFAAAGLATALGAQDARPAHRPLTADTVLVVGASVDTPPYSYFENGVDRGFAADLLDAVATAANLKIRRIPVNSRELAQMLEAGQLDIVQFWADTPERREVADFTVPILILQSVVVVRSDETRIRTLADLEGRTIATGAAGSVGTRYVREQVPGARIVNSVNPEDVLRLVASGECDAAVLSRLTALWRIDRLGLKNLRILDAAIEGYDIRDCMAVRRGDAQLLGRLNEGLAIVRASGEYDRIYYTWFGRLEPRRFTSLEVALMLAGLLALGLGVATFGFFRQRVLTRRISSQAAELLGQRSLHAALFDHHPFSTCVLEAARDGGAPHLLSLNREAAQLFGIDAATCAGLPLDRLSVSADLRRYLDDVRARWPAAGEPMHFETALRDARLLLETTMVALTPGSSGAARLCVITADVTRRRLADREIDQARRLRALGELVGGIAHEFNNLLTPVLMQSNLLAQERRADTRLVAELGLIEDAARRAATLTRRLLAFGRRADEGAPAVELRSAIESCVALLRPTFDRRIEWRITLPEGLPPVACDGTDLHQIIFNLVINARDTLVDRLGDTPTSPDWLPRLELEVAPLPASTHLPRQARAGATLLGWQRLSVTDNGRGIPPEHLERIFEPFFTTKEVGRGTGIGLSTVWHLVTESGGLIDVHSRPGEGSRFTVTLPAWSETPPSGISPPAGTPVARPIVDPTVSSHSILLVEDETIVAGAVLGTLRRLGHRVVHVTDGEAAWQEMGARGATYDVLLVDINMPRMNGVEFVQRVRTTPWAGRILVMSGRVAEPEMRTLEQLRVDRVLIKPFTPDDIAAALQPGTGTHGHRHRPGRA